MLRVGYEKWMKEQRWRYEVFFLIIFFSYRRTMIATLVQLLAFICVVSGKGDFHRLHYGITFTHMGRLALYDEKWLHTYSMPLPDDYISKTVSALPNCNKFHDEYYVSCAQSMKPVVALLNYTNVLHTEAKEALYNALHVIEKLIPETRLQNVPSRQTRSFLPWLGQLAKGAFGLATENDLRIVTDHIKIMARQMKNRDNGFNRSQHRMASFMTKINSRLDNIKVAIESNHKEITNLRTLEVEEIAWLKSFSTTLLILLGRELHLSDVIHSQSDLLVSGILQLIRGRLTPEILPVQILDHTLYSISEQLRKNYPQFALRYMAPERYYTDVDCHVTRKGNTLFITLFIPVVPIQNILQLFRTSVFPVPTHIQSPHSTFISNVNPYIAVSSTQQTFVELTHDQFQYCRGTHHIECTYFPPESSSDTPTCTMALFLNDIDLVHKLCKLNLLPNGTQTAMFELHSGSLLVLNVSKLTYACRNHTRVIEGCSFCIIPIPCSCEISLGNKFFPARLTSCKEWTDNVTKLQYPINVGLLRHFFTSNEILNEIPALISTEPFNYSTPEFKFANKTFSQIMNTDRMLSISLHQAVKLAKDNQIIYTDPVAMDGLEDIITSDWTSSFSYVSYAIWIILGIFGILLLYQQRQLNILRAHIMFKGISALTIPPPPGLNWIPPTTQAPPTKLSILELIDTYIKLEIVIVFILLVVIMTLAIYIYRLKTRVISKLRIHFSSATENTYLDILQVQAPPLSLMLSSSHFMPMSFQMRNLTSCLHKEVELEWPSQNLSLNNELSDTNIPLPNRFKVLKYHAKKINRITSGPYMVYISIIHAHIHYPARSITDPLPKTSHLYPEL